MRIVPIALLSVFVLFCCQRLQAYEFDFSNFTTSNGLSHKTITSFSIDKTGYLWIGTTNGLNRYDGYRFKNYMPNSDDSLALQGNLIREVVENADNSYWITTINGSFLFNPQDESFRWIRALGSSSFNSQNITVADDGSTWALLDARYLVSLDNRTRKITSKLLIDSLTKNKHLGAAALIRCINNKIWIATKGGLLCYDYQNRVTRIVTLSIPASGFWRFLKPGRTKDEIVVIDGIAGVFVVDAQNYTAKVIAKSVFKSRLPDILFISDAEYDKSGGLWVATTPGLFYITPKGETIKMDNTVNTNYNFDYIIANCLFVDQKSNVWIGTMNDGVFVLANKKNDFVHVSLDARVQRDLSIETILVTDKEIFGGNKQATFVFSKSNDFGKIKQINKIPYPTNSMKMTREGNIMLFSYDNVVEYYPATKQEKKCFARSNYQKGFVDSRGIVWTAHWGWGMYGTDPKSGKQYKLDIDTVDHNRNIITSMSEDGDGSFWIGTFGAGLAHVQNPWSAKPSITIYSHKKHENSISENVVLNIHDDGRGSIWLATNGGGLNRFDKKTAKFEIFTTKNGLRNNVIEAVNSDLDGNIWFVSSIISKYDVREKAFTHFDAADGVDSKYFTCASARDRNGNLYFGDNQGFVVFNPREIHKKNVPKQPILTGVRIFGKSINARDSFGVDVPFPIAIHYAQRVELPHYLNSLVIEYASIQMFDNKTIEYSYMLEGADNRWIPALPNEQSASYSGLQPGTYRFLVRASNGGNVWSEPRSVVIVISPPWWRSFLFKLLFTIVMAISISSIIYVRMRKIKNRNKVLEAMVANRTTELREANVQLSKQSEILIQQAQSLQEQNDNLQEQKLMIEVKNLQLNEALESKDKLIGIIAHDFKNPLSAVHGLSIMLRDNLMQFDLSKIKKYIEGIASASDNLKNQMLTVLDWAQSHVTEVTCHPTQLNIETIINDALALVRETAQQKQIDVYTQFDYSSNALVDPRMMSTVLRNLLVNAIKFTARGGNVTVLVQEYESGIEVSVIDTGVGMSQRLVDNLFADGKLKSAYGTENERGSGLGLQICKSFVEQNKGLITVRSQEGKGSTFSFTMPKGTELPARKKAKQTITISNDTNEKIEIAVDKSIHILIIDDNNNLVSLMKDMFEPYYTVVTAADGDAGLQLAQNTIPSLIISDVSMPLMSGIELCHQLKENDMTCHIPIILLTAEARYQTEGYASGADDFIEKPFNHQTMLLKVNALLENRQKMQIQMRGKVDSKGYALPESYNDKVVQKALTFINEHFADPDFDVNTVTDHIGMSRWQLWRKFKSTTGQNLSDYVQELRLLKAHEMLSTGKYRVAEVAYDVGFSNPQYFTRCFSARFGQSPRDCMDRSKVDKN